MPRSPSHQPSARWRYTLCKPLRVIESNHENPATVSHSGRDGDRRKGKIAAGLGTGTVYRSIGSKEDLLASIMQSFGEKVGAGWVRALAADASPIEKLDALAWLDINALAQFHDEFKIQLAWLRQSPPDTRNPGWSFATRLRQMQSLLKEGIRSGEIRDEGVSATMLARCVVDVLWIPENILRSVGTRAALVHARDTVLRGVADRAG